MQPPDTNFAPAAPAVDARGLQNTNSNGGNLRRAIDMRAQMHTNSNGGNLRRNDFGGQKGN